jgi:hypothetical protein
MNIGLKYTGLPVHITVDGITVKWSKILSVLKYINLDSNEFSIDGFKYLPYYGILYLNERDDWINQYLPDDGVSDKVVLDIGAGCGESAKFFLDNGAKKVICIESNIEAYRYLLKNSKIDNRIIPMNKYFDVSDLYMEHDFMKMDIEGAEISLLRHLDLYDKSCVVEAHNSYIVNKFINAGFIRYDNHMLNSSIMRRILSIPIL